MDKTPVPANARKAVLQLIELLQEAHFAARAVEAYFPVDRLDRLVDRIHTVRLKAEQLRAT